MAQLRLGFFFACDVVVKPSSKGLWQLVLVVPNFIRIAALRAIAEGGVFFC